MLWDLEEELANQYFNTWSTCIKLAWDLPRATHSFFLGPLSGGLITAMWDIITMYAGFYTLQWAAGQLHQGGKHYGQAGRDGYQDNHCQ